MKKYVADFETTTDPNDCRVWAYATSEIGNVDNVTFGNSIEAFMKWCTEKNKIVYFHNLKFDGSFIIDWLFKNGFSHSKEKISKSFNTLVSSQGLFYSIEVIFNRKGKTTQKVIFYDSLKKLPFPVEKIAKDFELPISKLKIDYNLYRPVGHVLTQKEIDYVLNDVKIISLALDIQLNQGLTKMTNGSDALNDFKKSISYKDFNLMFPILDLEIDKDIRQSYKGGMVYVNPKFQNKKLGKGIVLDVNSLYPSVMYNKPLPYGLPIFFEGAYIQDDMYPLFIQNVTAKFKVKKNHIPTIQLKKCSRFIPTEYITDSIEPVNMILTSIDLELFLKHYDVEFIEYHNGWKFKSSNALFKPYIDKWMKLKMENEGAIRQLAKLMLNSLYGKYGKNPDVTGKIPYLENGIVKWKKDVETISDPIYVPLASFVTSWARYITASSAQLCFDRFIYCDTDSLHLIDWEIPKELKHLIDPVKLGYWKIEGKFTEAKFIRQKTYAEMINGKLHVTCAGMPDRIKEKVTIDNFNKGFKSKGKLLPKRVVGGVVLEDTDFTLK